jgi:hypothetical protein
VRWIVVVFIFFHTFLYADLQYLNKTTPAHTNFDDVSTTGDNLNNDDGSEEVSLPFSFPFNGTNQNTVYIDTNGRVIFSNESDWSDDPLSNSSTESGMFPYWDDLDPRTFGEIKYGHLDSEGENERFVVWWDDVGHYNSGSTQNGHYSFQVALYKDGRIRFRYEDGDDADGDSATIGVKEDNSYYDQHLRHSNTLDRTKDLLYSPTHISGHIYEDPNGDSQMGDRIAKENVTVYLYRDGSTGSPYRTTTTDSNGYYAFNNVLVNQVYYVAVDSKTVAPDQAFNGSSDQGYIWAEQTYGGIGAQCADGSGGVTTRTTAGSCFGGKDGAVSDDASAYSTSEHVIRIDTNGNNGTTEADFGFSFNVVTSIRDGDDDTGADRSVQGSLRQFIQNANALSGANTMRFVPSVATNESSWWKITLQDDLDTVSDVATTLDGTAYNLSDGTSVRNTNSGTISTAVLTVGAGDDGKESSGDEHSLPTYEKQELEIDGGDHQIFNISSDNNRVQNMSFFNTNSRAIYLSGDSNTITHLIFGARADGTQPTSSGDRLRTGLQTHSSSSSNNVVQNYFAYISRTGIYFAGLGNIEENYMVHNADAAFNPDAITLEGHAASRLVRVWYNYIDGAGGYGIESWSAGGGYDIQYNTILNTGAVGTDELGGVRIFGVGSTIAHNIIKGSKGAGVAVVSRGSTTNRNIISRNVIYDNDGLSIDLDQTNTSSSDNPDGDGVTPNDGLLDSAKQNNDMDYPIITQATFDGNTLRVQGFVGSVANDTDFAHADLEVFIADDDGNNDGAVSDVNTTSVAHGEGKTFVFDCTSDGSGNFDCSYNDAGFDHTQLLTMTATLSSEGTSEFGPNHAIALLPEMHISKTSCVIDDPVNNTTNPKRIPGGTIRYAIEVSNTGVGIAEDTLAEDNVSTSFDETTITNLKIDGSHACNCLSPTSAGANGSNGGVSGNMVTLDFDTVAPGATECGYFEVQIQ